MGRWDFINPIFYYIIYITIVEVIRAIW